MPKASPQQPLVIACSWCGEQIDTVRERTLYDAADHAIDFHLLVLLAEPEKFDRSFTVRNPATGKPARIKKPVPPSSPQESAPS